MHSIQALRKKDPALRAALARRPANIDWAAFDALEAKRTMAQSHLETALHRRRQVADLVGQAKRNNDPVAAQAAMAEGTALAGAIPELEQQAQALADAQNAWVAALPNAPEQGVPIGEGESSNRLCKTVGEVVVRPGALDHVAIATHFGGIDTLMGAALAQSRFAVMQGPIARLHRALIQFMLDIHVDNGYREVNVPYLANAAALFGTGQLPKFAEDLFQTQDGLYLIPTAEVPLTNLVANTTLTPDQLPQAFVAHTPCFRREAGSAGRDVHGLIRQHQFEKVEIVRIEHPDNAEVALIDDVVASAEAILEALELPYRLVELCTGDLGFSSAHTFDLEVWLPSQGTYREISSCSNMGDFQARRMNARVKDGKQSYHPCTLNGSGLAVGRSLVALLENHIRPDGTLYLPERLRPYMGNRTHLTPE